MRLLGLLFATTMVLGGADRGFVLEGRVVELAAEGERGQQVAILTHAGPCPRIHVWSLSRRSTPRIDGGTGCGPATSTGRGLYGLAFGRHAAVWASYVGGNRREYSVWRSAVPLGTGRRPGPPARLFRVERDVDDEPPVVIGEADFGGSPFAIGRDVFIATADGVRKVVEEERSPLAVAGGGPYLLIRRSDAILVRDSRAGAEYARLPAGAAAKIDSTLVVLRAGRLHWYAIGSENIPSRMIGDWPLPRARSYGDGYCGRPQCPRADLRLEDLHDDLAVYVFRNEVHVVRLSSGHDVVVARGRNGQVEAQLEATGLSYSSGSRVAFVPRNRIAALLDR